MPRKLFDVVMAYHQDSIVEDLSSTIVYLQLAKLQGKPVTKFKYNSSSKEIETTQAVGGYDERAALLASMLLEHIKTYYPELLD